MIAFIEESRESFGVEPICSALQFAPSTYYDRRAIVRDPDRASVRARSDAALSVKIDAAWEDNRKFYGARKIWHVLRRDGEDVARCTVERLMRSLGIKGVVRGKKIVTTNPDTSLPCPDDKVNRLIDRTSCGFQTSLMCRRGRGQSTWPLAIGLEPMAPSMARSSTSSHGGSWAGVLRHQ